MKEKQTFRTNFGGITTIFLTIIMIVLLIIFGRDFYYRTNPLVITEIGQYSENPIYWLSNSNFTIVVGIENDSSIAIEDDSQVYIECKYFSYEVTDEGSNFVETYIPLTKCNQSHFELNKEENANRFKNHMCIDFHSLKVSGYWDSTQLNYFSLAARGCNKGDFSSSGTPCSSESEFSQPYYFSIYTQIYRISPSDYSAPLKYSLKNQFTIIDGKIMKYFKLFYQDIVVETDYGWLFKEIKTEKALSFNTVEADFATYVPEFGTLVNIDFFFVANFTNCTRIYTKIQSLAADVGGTMKFFFFFGMLLVNNYSQFKLKIYLYKSGVLGRTKSGTAENTQIKSILTDNYIKSIDINNKNNKVLNADFRSFENFDLNASKLKIKPSRQIKHAEISFFKYLYGTIFKSTRDQEFMTFKKVNKLLLEYSDFRSFIEKNCLEASHVTAK